MFRFLHNTSRITVQLSRIKISCTLIYINYTNPLTFIPVFPGFGLDLVSIKIFEIVLIRFMYVELKVEKTKYIVLPTMFNDTIYKDWTKIEIQRFWIDQHYNLFVIFNSILVKISFVRIIFNPA